MTAASKSTCIDDLRRRILAMELRPGADLDETSLSERYGLSRTPLREVLQRLRGEGYVTLSRNRGARVASMDLATMRTFFQTAPMVYSAMARLAAENRTDAQLQELRDVQGGFAQAVAAGRPESMVLANHRFHELIGEMAHNAYLMVALQRLLIDHARLGQVFYRPAAPAETDAIRQASDQHDAMIAAIAAHDGAAVTDLTLAHWGLSRDRMERFVRPDPLPMDISDFAEVKHAI